MKTHNRTLLGSALVLGGLVCSTTTTFGEPRTFTVDPTQSSLTVSASLNTFLGNLQLQQQAPGSLITAYGGTVEVDVTGSTIQFLPGSSIVASNSGNWQPGLEGKVGNAPANYGGQATGLISVKAAIRDIVVEAQSGVIPLSGGTFPAETLVFGFASNAASVLDYSLNGADGDGYPLSGYSTNRIGLTGALHQVGNEWVLTIPVDYTGYGWILSQNDLRYDLTGELVARASATVEPPLEIGQLQVAPGQLVFTIQTKIGGHYTILGLTNLTAAPETVDEFTATENPTVRSVNLPMLPQQFFQIRQN